jgi:hypothetical protein
MTAPKKTADDARIVVTLHFKLPKSYRDEFPTPTRLDAMNVVREWVKSFEGCDNTMLKMNLSRLIDNAESVSLDVAK